jgi:hypothetical protein
MTSPKKLLLLLAALGVVDLLVMPMKPVFAYNGDKPPLGSRDASCSTDNGTPYFCKIKIVSRTPGKLQVWLPEGRQSAMTFEYNGPCLFPGCVLTGEDWGYPEGPTKVEIIEATDSLIIWRAVSGSRSIEVFRILDQ